MPNRNTLQPRFQRQFILPNFSGEHSDGLTRAAALAPVHRLKNRCIPIIRQTRHATVGYRRQKNFLAIPPATQGVGYLAEVL